MSYESRRDERREWDSNVYYEVWRSGGNPDNINPDRMDDRFYNSQTAEEAASGEMRRERQARRNRREAEEMEQAEYDRAMEDHYQDQAQDWQEEAGDK